MKRNINLLQQNADLLNDDIFNEAQKEYVLQALANLGQRMGIKGDGLAYRSFNFLDLLENDSLTYSSSKYIGYLEYTKDQEDDQNIAVFGLYDFNSNTDKILESIVSKNVNDILYADREFSFTIPINGAEKYSKGTIISNKDNVLTIITAAKMAGYSDDDPLNTQLIYYKFDIVSNKIIYCAKIHHIYEDNKSDYFVLLRLTELNEKATTKYSNLYNLNIQIFNANVLSDTYKRSFTELFCFANYEDPSSLPFNILRPDFLDIDLLEGTDIYNNSSSINFDANSPVSVILNNESNTNFYTETNLTLSFDSNENEFESLTENFEEIISLYKNEYKFSNIEEIIYEFNVDMTELYRNMFLYFNDKFYIENRGQLYKRILCKLYEEISDETFGRLYIPLNYDINYICNSNDELNVYYSTDIYVLLTNINEKNDKTLYLSNNKYIIYDYTGIDMVKSYKFEVEYNKYYEDIINNVYIRYIYGMPYVNDQENWNINGENTNIRAVGRDAGNPNIIIIYSKNKNNDPDSYYVINAVKDKEIILKSGFEQRKFKIDPRLFTGLNNQNIYCYSYMPIIENDNKETFKHSIIINICDLNCLDNETYIDYFNGSNVITLWYYDYVENKYVFSLVTEDDSDCALPLGATTNIASILSRNKIAGINTNDIIILNAKISKLAHESLSTVALHYEILRNKTAIEYNTNSNISDDEYNYYNNLNAIIEYTDNLTINGSEVNYIQSEKYLIGVTGLDTTNILYPKYEIVTNIETNTVENVILKLESVLVTEEIISINVNNNGDILWTDEIRDKIEEVLVPSSETQLVEVEYKTINYEPTEYYDEYIFNSNVPTLDLKEVFVRNMNNLNRLNIISLDKEGKSYYAYLGTSYDEYNKSVFHISSINKNINVGSSTLIDEINRENFLTHNKVSIDFDNIYMNPTYVWSSHKSPIVEFNTKNKNYGMGTEWLTDTLFDLRGIDQRDLNKLNEDLVLKLKTNNPKLEITDTSRFRVGAVQFGELLYDYSSLVGTGLRKYKHTNTVDFKRFGVCINTIMLHLFNVDLDDYNDGLIRIFHGGNKMVVRGEFEDDSEVKLKEFIPYFFLLLNDEVACENNGILNTAENVDISYESFKYTKHDANSNSDIILPGINIYIEFGKHNNDGFEYVECKELILNISSGSSSEGEIIPDTSLNEYYWYCGINPIERRDLENIDNRRTIDNLITDDENCDPGWRILAYNLPADNVHDVDIWEGDDVYNNIVFPIDWVNFSENGNLYYLVIPQPLAVRDILLYEVPYDIIEENIMMLGHYYKILRSQTPWYEFAYSIYKP
jgi:hypothetical protein